MWKSVEYPLFQWCFEAISLCHESSSCVYFSGNGIANRFRCSRLSSGAEACSGGRAMTSEYPRKSRGPRGRDLCPKQLSRSFCSRRSTFLCCVFSLLSVWGGRWSGERAVVSTNHSIFGLLVVCIFCRCFLPHSSVLIWICIAMMDFVFSASLLCCCINADPCKPHFFKKKNQQQIGQHAQLHYSTAAVFCAERQGWHMK